MNGKSSSLKSFVPGVVIILAAMLVMANLSACATKGRTAGVGKPIWIFMSPQHPGTSSDGLVVLTSTQQHDGYVYIQYAVTDGGWKPNDRSVPHSSDPHFVEFAESIPQNALGDANMRVINVRAHTQNSGGQELGSASGTLVIHN